MAKGSKSGVTFAELRGLLGKPTTDPAFVAAMARAGKVVTKPDFVIAKDAGFDFAIRRPDDAKRTAPKVATTLFMFREGSDKHRQFADPPPGFAFTTRAELLAVSPPPATSWKFGKGNVPVETADVAFDRWDIDGVEIAANYRGGGADVKFLSATLVRHGGDKLSANPLHFEAKPADAPADAALMGMALLFAWGCEHVGLPVKHAGIAAKLKARAITPRALLIEACGKTVRTTDFDPALENFLRGYLNRMFIGEAHDARDKTEKAIAKLLRLHRDDERAYTDDFLGTFSKVLDNPHYVPDSWDAVDRIAPIWAARWADFSATEFERAPDLALYEQAAKLRDARSVVADRASVQVKGSADDKLTADMLGLVGKPLTDKAVKAVLARAGLPIGKKIDEQANPALGISYMGAKISGVLAVRSVAFHANKHRSYIRGIGGEVEFVGYPAALPFGVEFGASQDVVAGKLDVNVERDADSIRWRDGKRRIYCRFARGKLVEIDVGLPPE
ncbi:MAG TPA: hypothetical protein VGG28_10070 [Kofleriaceae bacterium]|jgi:hypothetical protein